MTAVTLRPNVYFLVTGGVAATGGGIETVLADDSDATYVSFPVGGGQLVLSFETVAMPTGSMARTARLRFRAQPGDGQVFLLVHAAMTIIVAGAATGLFGDAAAAAAGTPTDYAGFAAAMTGRSTQADIDQLGCVFYVAPPGQDPAEDPFLLYEVFIDLVYAEPPVVAVGALTDPLLLSSSAVVTWVYTPGDGGGAQARYQVKVFTAAEYSAPGFDPTTSTTTLGTGSSDGLGSSGTLTVGPLVTATTYRAYVRAAQTINGEAHWSEWDFDGFVTDFSGPALDSVVATADDTNGRILIEVVRDSGEPDWDTLTVERTDDDGATWTFLRGATAIVPDDPDEWSGYDYEAANGTVMRYRASAVGGAFAGPWVESNDETWSSLVCWLKDLDDPTLNTAVVPTPMPEPEFPIEQGVFVVIGRPDPVVVSDVRQLMRAEVGFETLTDEEAADVAAILDRTPLLLQMPDGLGFGSHYISPGQVGKRPASQEVATERYYWRVPFVEVARPPETT